MYQRLQAAWERVCSQTPLYKAKTGESDEAQLRRAGPTEFNETTI